MTELSKPIATEQRPLKPGLQTVAADDSVVAKVGNYQRTEGYADQQVQVNENGTVVPVYDFLLATSPVAEYQLRGLCA